MKKFFILILLLMLAGCTTGTEVVETEEVEVATETPKYMTFERTDNFGTRVNIKDEYSLGTFDIVFDYPRAYPSISFTDLSATDGEGSSGWLASFKIGENYPYYIYLADNSRTDEELKNNFTEHAERLTENETFAVYYQTVRMRCEAGILKEIDCNPKVLEHTDTYSDLAIETFELL